MTYSIVTGASYFAGCNIMRLLTSGFFGLESFKSNISDYKFYVVPLN